MKRSGMKSHTRYLTFNLPTRMGFENITRRVEEIVRESGVREGLVLMLLHWHLEPFLLP